MFYCLSGIDQLGKFLRVWLLHFSKDFDHIDHVLVSKLVSLDVRGFLIRWICIFLSGRRQAVKLGNVISQWMPLHGGVPHGTKLGPNMFLIMINDLALQFLYTISSTIQPIDWN